MTAGVSPERAALQQVAVRLEKRRGRTRNTYKIEALTEALRDVRALESEALRLENAMATVAAAQAPALEEPEAAPEPREPLRVVCTVTVPLSSPHAAADALSRVPINATVTYQKDGAGILAGVFGVGALIAQWTEER